MARVVKELAPHGLKKYPWDDWLDGQVWELFQGEDFTVSVPSFRATAIGKAKERGGKLRTRSFGKAIQIQFYKAE